MTRIVYVKLPEKLDGDPEQPNSVPKSGPWENKNWWPAVPLDKKHVWDPTIDPTINVLRNQIAGWEALDTAESVLGESPTHKGQISQARNHIDELQKKKSKGYEVTRRQRYVHVGTSTVNYGDTLTQSVSITLGSRQKTGYSSSEMIGVDFGTSTTDTTTVDTDLGVEAEGVKASVGLSQETSTTNSKNISSSLEITYSTESVSSKEETNTVSYEATGGENGARYVVWQIEDSIRVTRKYDNLCLSDTRVRSYTQSMKYGFTKADKAEAERKAGKAASR